MCNQRRIQIFAGLTKSTIGQGISDPLNTSTLHGNHSGSVIQNTFLKDLGNLRPGR